ncbi:MAG: FAD/NAD(P)-binding protein [Paracoccus sp. (in: a-proteobacteria)]|uniref:FAD/NAD(P)-binding protein n=1 Tax=Paracoccus sp. TaxID=267 RepID=UPI0039E69069
MGKGFGIAVIGTGPRALGALEALAAGARDGQGAGGLHVDMFDTQPHPGAGPNFDPRQSPLALLNLPLRALRLPAPPQGFPDFADWLAEADPEHYPPRAQLGAYFAARFQALARQAPFPIRVHPQAALHLDHDAADGWWLRGHDARHGPYAEVLLTQGQPATRPDPQLRRWREHAGAIGADLLPAYPARDLARAAQGWQGKAVAIRGMGLATLDVLRQLTLGLGGHFQGGAYHPSGREPGRILPFSLDGMPPCPKPATAMLDAALSPTPQESADF